MEEWRDIIGFEGYYKASDLGRVKSLRRNGTISNERILKGTKHHTGYVVVQLQKNGSKKMALVQCLVWEAFNGEKPEGMQVNHINEDKTDNRLCNLNLMTPKENTNWGTGIQRRKEARKNGNGSKPVIQLDLDGNYINEYPSTREVFRQTGYFTAAISGCCNGKYKQAYGYVWKFKKDVV